MRRGDLPVRGTTDGTDGEEAQSGADQPAEEQESGEQQPEQPDVAIVAENLEIPWEITFLPNGDLLVTERPGRLLSIGENRRLIEVDGVRHVGEGGLLGLALHPNFSQNGWIYLYLTTQTGDGLINRVERYQLVNNNLTNRQEVLTGIPGARFHDGGRIEFGPDGRLYVTTGDAGTPANAQNINSLAGKILRVNADGTTPDDNPFGNPVYSYGHRNPQGLAWDENGRMWATEHGPSGAQSGFDELNRIDAGANYGWPAIRGAESGTGMQTPVRQSGTTETWAPAGMAWVPELNSLFFAGLRGESLYQAELNANGNVASLHSHLRERFGRLRAVVRGPDGALYVSTSNRDGRGGTNARDDKIIRINPEIFRR